VFEQSEMFPEIIPPDVVRFWKAALTLYELSRSKTKLTMQEVVDRMKIEEPTLPASVETIRRWRRETYPDLIDWPIKRGQLPPWCTRPEILAKLFDAAPVPLQSCDTLHLQTIEGVPMEMKLGEDGVYRITRWGGGLASMLAAGYALFLSLDGMDGHIDHVVHWCRVLAGILEVAQHL